jgi:SpoVK/Ycf46/Vps4 family AAA+-type ATPase
MARTDLLLSLVRAGSQGDQLAFRRTLEAVVAEERQKQHHVLADRLAEYLKSDVPSGGTVAREASGFRGLVDTQPQRRLDDLTLPNVVKRACRDLIEEQQRADLLRSHSLEPRHRVLLAGPPGNGKTSLAEALATELTCPLLVVRYEAVIGSFLGETAARLAQTFDAARTRRCVLFFDEFDSVAKERGDEHETGEIKRVVSSLLLNVDRLPSYVVVVAATNHPELLDRAVWRRFQLRLMLPPPRPSDAERWLDGFEARTGLKLGISRKRLMGPLRGASYAEVEDFCVTVQRRVVLAGPEAHIGSIVSGAFKEWAARFKARR